MKFKYYKICRNKSFSVLRVTDTALTSRESDCSEKKLHEVSETKVIKQYTTESTLTLQILKNCAFGFLFVSNNNDNVHIILTYCNHLKALYVLAKARFRFNRKLLTWGKIGIYKARTLTAGVTLTLTGLGLKLFVSKTVHNAPSLKQEGIPNTCSMLDSI